MQLKYPFIPNNVYLIPNFLLNQKKALFQCLFFILLSVQVAQIQVGIGNF